MFSYPLRARTLDDQAYFSFTVKDGICRINSTEFVLLNKNFSPILKLSTIQLGNEDGSYFENDIIQSNNKLYKASYKEGGFVFISGYETKVWTELENPTILGATEFQQPLEEKRRFMYSYEGKVFSLNLLRGCIHEYPLTDSLGWYSMHPELIKQSTTIQKPNGKFYFFGDSIDGEVITMVNGRVMLGAVELIEIIKICDLAIK